MSQETLSQDWEISEGKLKPVPAYIRRLLVFLSQKEGEDILVCFKYAEKHQENSILVHESRMEWAGGRFREINRQLSSVQRSRIVCLPEDDDPEAFRIIRDFLYTNSISLSVVPFPVLLRVARAAHRWHLTPLFSGIFHFIEDAGLLQDQDSLLEAVDVFSLPGVPQRVLFYFWRCVGINFGNFGYLKDSDISPSQSEAHIESHLVSDRVGMDTNVTISLTDDPPKGAETGPKFPNLWAMALSQSMVQIAMQNILRNWTVFDGYLLNVVLQYLEPRIKEDEAVCRLVSELSRSREILEAKLENSNLDAECTPRAVRLLAKALNNSRHEPQETRYSWRLAVAEETNFVRNVFLCPDFPGTSNITYRDAIEANSSTLGSGNSNALGSRKKLRPSKYEILCQNSVKLTLSVGLNSKQFVVSVRWCVGNLFLGRKSMLSVLIEITDDGCECSTNDSKYSGKGGCLGRATSTTGVEDGGLLTVSLDDELLEVYRKAHGPRCAITISLVVKLLRT